MTTAEKITLGVAIAGAFGLGSVVAAFISHLLGRRERKVNIADKSVQIAEAMMTRMEGELTRVQQALAKAQHESEELRATLAETKTAKGKLSEQLEEAKKSLQGVNVQIGNASTAIGDMQVEVRQYKATAPDRRSARGRFVHAPAAQAQVARLMRQNRERLAAESARDVGDDLGNARDPEPKQGNLGV
ncbi:hypothetical protein [Micromonospora chalcea]|uniref:hypothetical protein n=1 Tax=Micromonospora chalcea TaxID=1874 RepID=UPI00333112BD